jgi:hypothetical protein
MNKLRVDSEIWELGFFDGVSEISFFFFLSINLFIVISGEAITRRNEEESDHAYLWSCSSFEDGSW